MTDQEDMKSPSVRDMIDSWLPDTAPSDRKMRLWACAMCRQFWNMIPDTRSRAVILVAEQFADGLADRQQLGEARRAAEGTFTQIDSWGMSTKRQRAAASRAVQAGVLPIEGHDVARVIPLIASQSSLTAVKRIASYLVGWPDRKEVDKGLADDVFYCSPVINPAWLLWNDGCVKKLAQAAYEERDLTSGYLDNCRLGILADALEEAGCSATEILAHLRGPEPHVRACWVLDSLLAKELGKSCLSRVGIPCRKPQGFFLRKQLTSQKMALEWMV
jgi:hypothetical protein